VELEVTEVGEEDRQPALPPAAQADCPDSSALSPVSSVIRKQLESALGAFW
jgi:hypothetical protein